ncbi:DUF5313 family protein [uncultured Jatrophihabitans sp.]|uniref:DUF5313 family protein n=1 Tax=uncultured Jatrophihabitans sp. TaxID=1610747 RepID=UPI0035CB6F69
MRKDARERAWTEAARSLDIDPVLRKRPNPLRWLLYAFWGPLPERFQIWVLYDGTCSTWVLRHVSRLLIVASLPVAAVIVFLPGPLHVRVLTAVVAGLGGFLFAVVWVNEATDLRLVRAGWYAEVGPELRKRRSELAEWIGYVRRL